MKKLLFALLLLAVPVWGQDVQGRTLAPAAGGGGVSYVIATPLYSSSGATASVSLGTVTAGHTLGVILSWPNTTTLTSVTACGNTFTMVGSPTSNTNSGMYVQAGYVLSSTGGTCTLQITLAASGAVFAGVHEISGATVYDGSTCNVQASTTATNGVLSGSITTTGANDYVWALTTNPGGATEVAGNLLSWTQRLNSGATGTFSEDISQGGAGPIQATFTQSGFGNPSTCIMAFK